MTGAAEDMPALELNLRCDDTAACVHPESNPKKETPQHVVTPNPAKKEKGLNFSDCPPIPTNSNLLNINLSD